MPPTGASVRMVQTSQSGGVIRCHDGIDAMLHSNKLAVADQRPQPATRDQREQLLAACDSTYPRMRPATGTPVDGCAECTNTHSAGLSGLGITLASRRKWSINRSAHDHSRVRSRRTQKPEMITPLQSAAAWRSFAASW